jgi:hypothetical protein
LYRYLMPVLVPCSIDASSIKVFFCAASVLVFAYWVYICMASFRAIAWRPANRGNGCL